MLKKQIYKRLDRYRTHFEISKKVPSFVVVHRLIRRSSVDNFLRITGLLKNTNAEVFIH